MTLFEMIFSIPGLIAMTFLGPIALGLVLITIRDFSGWIADTVQSFRSEDRPRIPTAPKGENVIEIDTIAALAHIKNHPAMRFVEKA